MPRPMGLLRHRDRDLGRLPGAIPKGLQDGADTAQEDFANPGNFVTKPLSEVGKLPVISSLPTSLTNSTVSTTGGKMLPGLNKPTGTTSSVRWGKAVEAGCRQDWLCGRQCDGAT